MSQPTRFQYKAAGPTLERFHQSSDFVRMLLGPLGSAKTTACCFELWRRACEQEPDAHDVRRSRWLVVRNTYPELETTTIKSWLEMFPENQFGRFVWSKPPRHHIKRDLVDGTKVDMEVFFLAMDGEDSVKKLLSFEVTGIYYNEVKELPRAVLDMGTGRVGRFPAMRQGGPTWHGIIADTNMPDDDHWIKNLNDDPPENWQFFRQPGGVIKEGNKWVMNPNAENIQNLVPGYYRQQMGGKKEEWIKVYLAAEYGFSFDGRPVFPDYLDSVHCRPFEINDGDATFGVDFGLTPAAVLGQRDVRGRWLIFDEIVTESMGAVRFTNNLGRVLRGEYGGMKFKGFGDPAGEQRSQVDERTPFQVMKAGGIPIRPAPTNDALIRVEAVAEKLVTMIDGIPALLIHPRCKRLRRALAGGFCYRRVKIMDEDRYHDVPDKNLYSHVAEALEYLMVGNGEGRTIIKKPRQYEDRDRQMEMPAERMDSPFDVRIG